MNIPFFSCAQPLQFHSFGRWTVQKTVSIMNPESNTGRPIGQRLIQARVCEDCGFVQISNTKVS